MTSYSSFEDCRKFIHFLPEWKTPYCRKQSPSWSWWSLLSSASVRCVRQTEVCPNCWWHQHLIHTVYVPTDFSWFTVTKPTKCRHNRHNNAVFYHCIVFRHYCAIHSELLRQGLKLSQIWYMTFLHFVIKCSISEWWSVCRLART